MRKSKDNKKAKLIRKGHGKESTVIEFNLSKAVILLIIVGVIISGIVTKEIVTTIIETNQRKILANEKEYITEQTVPNNDTQTMAVINGDLGKITLTEIKSVRTGVGPFDDNNNPGNDSSEDNNIVRSFDQVTWTIEATMGLKTGTTETNLKGGVIEVEASLPEHLANLVEWDLDSMLWLEEANLSEDGISLTGKYTMEDTEITIPGKKNLIFVLQVKNATQGTEIQPTFITKLTGNEESEKVTITAEKIIVSSKGKYNLEIHRNNNLSVRTMVNYGNGNTEGRMYGYSFAVQLYNDNESKKLKGLEYPEGQINFDIDLKLERSDFESENMEDITAEATPIRFNIK